MTTPDDTTTTIEARVIAEARERLAFIRRLRNDFRSGDFRAFPWELDVLAGWYQEQLTVAGTP